MASTPTHPSDNSGSKSGSSSGGGGGGGGGSSAADAYAKAQKKAEKEAQEQAKKQAETLQDQVDALRVSFSSSFLKALKIRLANFKLGREQTDAQLLEGYAARVNDLRGATADNQKSLNDDSFRNLANRGRERANAVTEATAQGAGESDILKAQLMSLRNWDSNQAEINRSYFDTQRTIGSSLTDLTIDTKTARQNAWNQYNEQRDQAWTNYYNQRSETATQIGNVLGQQAALYGQADESSKQKSSSKASGKAFDEAAEQAAQAWKMPELPAGLRDWKGSTIAAPDTNYDNFVNAATQIGSARKKPEGANLRSWT